MSAVTSLELESSRCPLWSASVSCSGSPLVGQKTVIQPDPELVSSLLNFSDAEDTEEDSGDDHDQEESRLETEPEQEDAASPQPEDEKSSWRKQRKCPESPRRIQRRKYSQCPTNGHLPIIRYYIVCEAYHYHFKC